MNCRNCNATYVDGDIYCPECGERLDGLVRCKKCKTWVRDTHYCVNCGRDMYAKPFNLAEFLHLKDLSWSKISPWIIHVASMIATLLVVVFAFFIGGTLIDSYGHVVSSSGMTADNIWYYFGQAFKDVDNLGESLQYSELHQFFITKLSQAGTTYAVAGLITTVITLGGVLALGTISLVKSIKGIVKGEIGEFNKFSILAVIVYLVGVSAFVMLNATTIRQYFFTLPYSYQINSATVVGIVLALCFSAISVTVYLINNFKCVLERLTIKRGLVSISSGALIMVVVILLSNLTIQLGANASAYDFASVNNTAFIRDFIILVGTNYGIISNIVITPEQDLALQSSTVNLDIANVLSSVSIAIMILVAVIGALNLIGEFKDKKSNSRYALPIVLVVSLVILLIVNIFMISAVNNAYADIIVATGDIANGVYVDSTVQASLIVALVLAIANLVVKIVFRDKPIVARGEVSLENNTNVAVDSSVEIADDGESLIISKK
ncbi:MAG: zinc ribbon domain-containing protein [Clostridia bacterium]|nr:zinc ribbon domain-containing protein [Clostridia bacterium]